VTILSHKTAATMLAFVALTAALNGSAGPVAGAEPVPPVAVFGDSLTYHGSRPLAESRPRWYVDAVRGRQARAYPGLIRAYTETYGPPSRLVLALGTNEVGATRELYGRALADLPARTPVVLVTTYRDPAVYGVARARTMARISRWMREASRSRPHTCIAPWRRLVVQRPELLHDGVHATARGEAVWARTVASAMERCTTGPGRG
jgi:hypothetical protein